MNLKRLVPVLVFLVLGSACSAEGSASLDGAGAFEASVDDAAVAQDASFVVRASLRAGSTGADAGELGEKYIELPVVIGTRGDDGDSVALFLAPGASADEAEAVKNDLSQEPTVEQVSVERRK